MSASTETVDDVPVVVIEPSRGWRSLNLREVWSYRELLYFFVWRDAKIRYKQTAVGVIWALVQPLAIMLLFSAIFGRLVGVPSDGVPYPIFIFAALLTWQLFAYALSHASTSLVANEQLVTKIYFPRVLIPVAASCAGLIEFGIGLLALAGFMAYYGIAPTLAALALPAFVLLAVGATLGFALWLSALNVYYRDVQYTIPFLTQFLFFATPVVYPATLVPEPWRGLLGVNPMTGVVEGMRWALFDRAPDLASVIPLSIVSMIVLLVTGLLYFRRVERAFADVV